MGSMSGPVTPYSNRPYESGLCRDSTSVDGRILAVRVIVGIRQRLRVDALTTLVCTSIDGVTPVASPVLGHSCARCGGRAHMKSSTREEEEARVL